MIYYVLKLVSIFASIIPQYYHSAQYSEPIVTAVITTPLSGGIPTVKQSYTLTCAVDGANISFEHNFQWIKNNNNYTEASMDLSGVLLFFPLNASDAGKYACKIYIQINSRRTVTLISESANVYVNRKCICSSSTHIF